MTGEDPWPGLASFAEADQASFHGRDREAEALVDMIGREPIVLLFGVSGVGKTSLLRAAVIPRLRYERVFPLYLRLDFDEDAPPLARQVLNAVSAEAAACGVEAPATRESDTLWEFFQRRGNDFWDERNRLVTPVLIFDQFEEIFLRRRAAAETITVFLRDLADLALRRPPVAVTNRLEAFPEEAAEYDTLRRRCSIVLSLREDFIGAFSSWTELDALILRNRLRLQPMNSAGALRAVTASGLADAEVATEIVRLVSGAGNASLADVEVEPTLLSAFCAELNRRRHTSGQTRITSDLLYAPGDFLTRIYEKALAHEAPSVRAFIEDALVTPSGFRESIAVDKALERGAIDEDALQRLVLQRVLRIDVRNGVRRVEMLHDWLARVAVQRREMRKWRPANEVQELTAIVRRLTVRNRVLIAAVMILTAALLFVLITR